MPTKRAVRVGKRGCAGNNDGRSRHDNRNQVLHRAVIRGQTPATLAWSRPIAFNN